jgi:predicted HTH domain antitoxin
MMSKVYPLRLPDNLMKLVELRSTEERVDKATALRQILYEGAEGYVLKLLAEGRISLSYACDILDRSPFYIYELAKRHNIELGSDENSYEEGQKILKNL